MFIWTALANLDSSADKKNKKQTADNYKTRIYWWDQPGQIKVLFQFIQFHL